MTHDTTPDTKRLPRATDGADPPTRQPTDPNQTPTEAVITIVATIVATLAGVAPTELDPLYESVDTDVLDALFAQPAPSADGHPVSVEFRYAGYHLQVQPNGQITLLGMTRTTA